MAVKIKLKEITEIKGVSQRQLSLKSGIDIKSVQRIMRNSFTIVTTETLGKFAEILAIDVSALVESEPPLSQIDKNILNSAIEIQHHLLAENQKPRGKAVRLKIKEIAQAKGIHQSLLGRMAGIDTTTMHRIYTNPRTVITTRTLDRIAKALEVNAALLIESVPDEMQSKQNMSI